MGNGAQPSLNSETDCGQPVIYIYDIETAPLPAEQIIGLAPEFSAPSNWKDEKKIEAEVARKRAEWLTEAALNPLTGEVVAVGFKRVGELPRMSMGKPEDELLKTFWQSYEQLVQADFAAKFLGFCSNRFDLPFIMRRSWKTGVPVPEHTLSGTYPCERFMDLARFWQLGNREDTISLDRLARYLGVGAKETNGADFATLLKTDPAKAEEYLRNDLNLTEACARKMGVVR